MPGKKYSGKNNFHFLGRKIMDLKWKTTVTKGARIPTEKAFIFTRSLTGVMDPGPRRGIGYMIITAMSISIVNEPTGLASTALPFTETEANGFCRTLEDNPATSR